MNLGRKKNLAKNKFSLIRGELGRRDVFSKVANSGELDCQETGRQEPN